MVSELLASQSIQSNGCNAATVLLKTTFAGELAVHAMSRTAKVD